PRRGRRGQAPTSGSRRRPPWASSLLRNALRPKRTREPPPALAPRALWPSRSLEIAQRSLYVLMLGSLTSRDCRQRPAPARRACISQYLASLFQGAFGGLLLGHARTAVFCEVW